MVQDGYLEVQVDTALEDCTIRKLNQAVLDVQAGKGSFDKLVDTFAVYWTPGVLVVALALVLIGGGVSHKWREYSMKVIPLLPHVTGAFPQHFLTCSLVAWSRHVASVTGAGAAGACVSMRTRDIRTNPVCVRRRRRCQEQSPHPW